MNNGTGQAGDCANCMIDPFRVGDSFVADANRFAQATVYAVDNNFQIVQEALGTLNNTRFAREAVDYAYNHGVVVIASAADEAAQHHNYVSSLPHTIVVNSIDKYPSTGGVPEENPKSYLTFNGCTNFSSKITVSIPSTSCSSNATEVAAGIAGLIYSAALNARDQGKLQPSSDCQLANGQPCPITANEMRQLIATGSVGGISQVDDVNFTTSSLAVPTPEPSCSPSPSPGCTDPNLALQSNVNSVRPVSSPPDSQYVWAYHVKIQNSGGETVQLVTRYWRITDAFGRVQEVRGPGVVGEQPLLHPGESFQYTSNCELSTSTGIMKGTYQMVTEDGDRFDAQIAPFALHEPYTVH